MSKFISKFSTVYKEKEVTLNWPATKLNGKNSFGVERSQRMQVICRINNFKIEFSAGKRRNIYVFSVKLTARKRHLNPARASLSKRR